MDKNSYFLPIQLQFHILSFIAEHFRCCNASWIFEVAAKTVRHPLKQFLGEFPPAKINTSSLHCRLLGQKKTTICGAIHTLGEHSALKYLDCNDPRKTCCFLIVSYLINVAHFIRTARENLSSSQSNSSQSVTKKIIGFVIWDQISGQWELFHRLC